MAQMYFEILELVFVVGGFIALFMGFLLIFKPDLVANLSRFGNKWYSARKSTKPLDIMRDTDSFYFNNNQLIGSTMLVISILALYLIYSRIPDTDEYLAAAGNTSANLGVGILLESLRWILLILITIGLPMWGLLTFNPEKLKKLNTYLDKWISTRLLLLPLEQMNDSFDVFVLQNHRIFGAFFVIGAGFILFNFLR